MVLSLHSNRDIGDRESQLKSATSSRTFDTFLKSLTETHSIKPTQLNSDRQLYSDVHELAKTRSIYDRTSEDFEILNKDKEGKPRIAPFSEKKGRLKTITIETGFDAVSKPSLPLSNKNGHTTSVSNLRAADVRLGKKTSMSKLVCATARAARSPGLKHLLEHSLG